MNAYKCRVCMQTRTLVLNVCETKMFSLLGNAPSGRTQNTDVALGIQSIVLCSTACGKWSTIAALALRREALYCDCAFVTQPMFLSISQVCETDGWTHMYKMKHTNFCNCMVSRSERLDSERPIEGGQGSPLRLLKIRKTVF